MYIYIYMYIYICIYIYADFKIYELVFRLSSGGFSLARPSKHMESNLFKLKHTFKYTDGTDGSYYHKGALWSGPP